jgi:subtilisin family serine protease
VIDTGIDLANPELDAVSGTNCVKPGTSAQDDNGHGTNVAGIIAARNTGSGVVGVAPGHARVRREGPQQPLPSARSRSSCAGSTGSRPTRPR